MGPFSTRIWAWGGSGLDEEYQGRKHWLFAGRASGAETAAILFSVTSTCQRHRLDAFAYMRDLLERLAHDPQPSPEVLRNWLPDRWRPPLPDSPADS